MSNAENERHKDQTQLYMRKQKTKPAIFPKHTSALYLSNIDITRRLIDTCNQEI